MALLSMKTILALNSGSSSIKASLYEVLPKSLRLVHQAKSDRPDALSELLPQLSLDGIVAIGHRFVHGGQKYHASVRLTPKVLKDLEALVSLAPLHNKPALQGIQQAKRLFGNKIAQVAVFDTAFFQTLPQKSQLYAIPQELAKKYAIQRYGFHGISHAYLWQQYVKATGNKKGKIITLHLGAGCSVAAIDSGRPIDTSMGFTPAEGLVMATRAGDLDIGIVPYLCEKAKLTPEKILDLCNFKSGLLGLSGHSSDMKTLLPLYGKEPNVTLAIDLFCYRLVKYLGAYIAALGGCEAIIFSAGIGEHAPKVRQLIIKEMNWYGIQLDAKKNREVIWPVEKISSSTSTVDLYVIKTDENQYIANQTRKILYSSS